MLNILYCYKNLIKFSNKFKRKERLSIIITRSTILFYIYDFSEQSIQYLRVQQHLFGRAEGMICIIQLLGLCMCITLTGAV